MACLKGFEPPTNGLEGRCSILLSYRHRQCVVWSGWWESDPRSQLGRLVFYHWTTPALQQPLHYISVAKNCQRFEIFFCDFFREVSYFWQQVTNFATTFAVIRLLKASTSKNLWTLLSEKCNVAGHKNLPALPFWNAVEKHRNLHHNFETKVAPVVCRLYKPDKVRQRQKQPCEVVAYNYLFSCCITFELRSLALRSCTLRKFA